VRDGKHPPEHAERHTSKAFLRQPICAGKYTREEGGGQPHGTEAHEHQQPICRKRAGHGQERQQHTDCPEPGARVTPQQRQERPRQDDDDAERDEPERTLHVVGKE